MEVSSPSFKKSRIFILVAVLLLSTPVVFGKTRRPPRGGRIAVIVDERLSALRESPELSGKLLQRISRGRFVAVRSERYTRSGIVFASVNLTSRTRGWVQRDALVAIGEKGADEKLLRLIKASEEFDRISRARIFLDSFSRSALRPAVLLILGDTAEAAAARLSRDAMRRLHGGPMAPGAPEFSYFLNYTGLDRYNRQGIRFVFDPETRTLHYDGASWNEILRRHPRSPEATEARQRLAAIKHVNANASTAKQQAQ